MTLTLPLTPAEEAKLLAQARAQGSTPEELVRQAIEPILNAQRDEFFDVRKEEIRRKIDEGLASLRRGEGVDGEEAFRHLDERHERYRRER